MQRRQQTGGRVWNGRGRGGGLRFRRCAGYRAVLEGEWSVWGGGRWIWFTADPAQVSCRLGLGDPLGDDCGVGAPVERGLQPE